MNKTTFILIFLVLASMIIVSADKIDNSKPDIRVEFNETVTIVNYTLRRKIYGHCKSDC